MLVPTLVKGLDAEHPDAVKTALEPVHPDAVKTALEPAHPDAAKTVLVREHLGAVKTVPKMTFVIVKQANLWSSSSESVQACRHARPTCLKHTLPYALHLANSAA